MCERTRIVGALAAALFLAGCPAQEETPPPTPAPPATPAPPGGGDPAVWSAVAVAIDPEARCEDDPALPLLVANPPQLEVTCGGAGARNFCGRETSKVRWQLDLPEELAGSELLVRVKVPAEIPSGYSPSAFSPPASVASEAAQEQQAALVSGSVEILSRLANRSQLRFVDGVAVWPYELELLDAEGNRIACGDPVIIIRDL